MRLRRFGPLCWLTTIVVSAPLLVSAAGARVPPASGAQRAAQPSAAAGIVTGFVRINGDSLPLKYAYAFIAPDSFDEKVPVKIVLASATPIDAAALAAVTTRRDVTKLLTAGAIVEVNGQKHEVFLRHKGLKEQEIQTGGDFTPKVNTPARVSGKVTTFTSGDEDKFGFKVRFEITFDAPVLKTVTKLK